MEKIAQQGYCSLRLILHVLSLPIIQQFENYSVSLQSVSLQCVPLATEPAISLIILPLMRILRLQTHTHTHTHTHTLQTYTHTTDTHCRHTHYRHTHYRHTHCRRTLQTHTTDTHYRHTHYRDTHCRHTLQTHTTDTFLFISHTTNVLLFDFRCNILIGVRIIKEMPGSVASGTHCISVLYT